MPEIDYKLCEHCGTCVGCCPADAIIIDFNVLFIDTERCTECGICVTVCPVDALRERS